VLVGGGGDKGVPMVRYVVEDEATPTPTVPAHPRPPTPVSTHIPPSNRESWGLIDPIFCASYNSYIF
jgi:hypothetical protein